jgi:hypothetical protein
MKTFSIIAIFCFIIWLTVGITQGFDLKIITILVLSFGYICMGLFMEDKK